MAIWQFLQLLNFSFLEEFEINESSESVFDVHEIDKIMNVVHYITLHFSGMSALIFFFVAVLLVLGVGGYTLIYNVLLKIYDLLDSRYEDCSFPLQELPSFIQSLLYEAGYIPILSAILPVFICTYHCDYKPGADVDPYPPLDVYTQISCLSLPQIVCFAAGVVAVVVFFKLSSKYLVIESTYYDSTIIASKRFQYFEQIMNVCFSLLFFP